jgi:hypothetical protein
MAMAEQLVRLWNRQFPAGSKVELVNDDGKIEQTETRSEAWLTGSGAPVVKVKGRAGGYLLTRIQPPGGWETDFGNQNMKKGI